MIQLTWPIRGSYRITQRFAQNLLDYSQFGLKGHDGIDAACAMGTPIIAPADGIIADTYGLEKPNVGGFGNHVRMLIPDDNNPNQFYEFIAGHLLTVLVKPGDEVKRGQVLGLSDNSGWSFGAHLHWGVRKLQKGKTAGYTTKVYLNEVYAILDYDNGFYGYFDPLPLVEKVSDNVYNVDSRYGQPYSATREWLWKIRHEKYAREQAMKRGVPFDQRLINAFVYAFWDIETVMNPAMFAVWRELTKPAYLKLIKTPVEERVDIIK